MEDSMEEQIGPGLLDKLKAPIEPKRKTTVGLFASVYEDPYHVSILKGAFDAARENSLNLVAYVGGELGSTLPNRLQRNVIYDLAT